MVQGPWQGQRDDVHNLECPESCPLQQASLSIAGSAFGASQPTQSGYFTIGSEARWPDRQDLKIGASPASCSGKRQAAGAFCITTNITT